LLEIAVHGRLAANADLMEAQFDDVFVNLMLLAWVEENNPGLLVD
jgi:hypothetical protein